MVWIVARATFWIGYHYGSHYRALGLPGMMQSILLLCLPQLKLFFSV